MSAETYSALEDAIRAHVNDEAEGIATDWYLIVAAESMNSSETTNYLHVASQSPLHTLHGLVNLGQRRLLLEHDDD